jgi:hypothetical protein
MLNALVNENILILLDVVTSKLVGENILILLDVVASTLVDENILASLGLVISTLRLGRYIGISDNVKRGPPMNIIPHTTDQLIPKGIL